MIDLEIKLLVRATMSVTTMMSVLRSVLDVDADNAAKVPLLSDLQHSAGFIRDIARASGMDATEAGASRLVEGLQTLKTRHVNDAGKQLRISEGEIVDLERNVDYLVMCFHDQLNAKHGLFLTNEEARLYHSKEPLFGKDVFEKFNDAARDIAESGKCLALGRNTACVFHLMLAMERALRAMATKIEANVHDKHGNFDRWSVIVGNVKAAIPALPRKKQDAWTEAHNLLAVCHGKRHGCGFWHARVATTPRARRASAYFDACKPKIRSKLRPLASASGSFPILTLTSTAHSTQRNKL